MTSTNVHPGHQKMYEVSAFFSFGSNDSSVFDCVVMVVALGSLSYVDLWVGRVTVVGCVWCGSRTQKKCMSLVLFKKALQPMCIPDTKKCMRLVLFKKALTRFALAIFPGTDDPPAFFPREFLITSTGCTRMRGIKQKMSGSQTTSSVGA